MGKLLYEIEWNQLQAANPCSRNRSFPASRGPRTDWNGEIQLR